MARAKKTESTAVVRWDEELAKAAEASAKMEENTGGGSFFSIKSGVLKWQDNPMPNNEMAVIILDHIFENVYYQGEYDPDEPQSPAAFAFARDEKDLVWHESSIPELAGKPCKDTEVCQWGSADKGKRKAAKETRRLAMVSAGSFGKDGAFKFVDDEEHYASTTVGFMRLPITSVRGWGTFVKQIAGALKRPPHGIITRVKVIPDEKSQFRVLFEPIANCPNEIMGAIMKRREEVMAMIDFPYQIGGEEGEEKKPASKAAKKKTSRRY